MRGRRALIGCVLVATAWCPARGGADTGTATDALARPMFTFGGFGTLGVVHSSNDKADFAATAFEGTGAGHTRSWSPGVDSVLAGQVDGHFTSKLSGVLQVIAQQSSNDTYWPQIEWASIQYQFTQDFSVRMGRTALPVFLLTDSRRIGYANPWVRPPVEVYSLLTVDNNDGIDARYHREMAGGIDTLQLSAGRTAPKFPPSNAGGGSGTAEVRRQVALVNTFERVFTTLRVNYYQSRLTVSNLETLFRPYREFGPAGIAVADRFDVRDRQLTFFGMSASYDPGDWFAMGEWARINTHSVLGDNSGWYASVGYHFSKITPYATYARVKANSSTSDPGLDPSAVPSYLAGTVVYLNSLLNATLKDLAVQRTISIGGRWDFMSKVDAKIQFDHTNLGPDSAGTLRNLVSGFRPGGTVNLFTATIDFVF
jgi:hypothetical protein